MIDRKSVLPRSLLALTLWSLSATAMAANLRVGAARVDITPRAEMPRIRLPASMRMSICMCEPSFSIMARRVPS